MLKTGKSFLSPLGKANLRWGEERKTNSRSIRKGEAYITIPAKFAREIGIYNDKNCDMKGKNIFDWVISNGIIENGLKTAGNKCKGDPCAKNLQSNNNLKLLGKWLNDNNAEVGDKVLVEFIADDSVKLTVVKRKKED